MYLIHRVHIIIHRCYLYLIDPYRTYRSNPIPHRSNPVLHRSNPDRPISIQSYISSIQPTFYRSTNYRSTYYRDLKLIIDSHRELSIHKLDLLSGFIDLRQIIQKVAQNPTQNLKLPTFTSIQIYYTVFKKEKKTFLPFRCFVMEFLNLKLLLGRFSL